ncbi:cytochrome P450 [Nonomuraea sp. PA05]|uniref:cytochrome P450 n=1 Tax=Nonomuraea sp. PA05 TaxID=2604466 RepID=UPI0011D5464A|nr:cytochrome P450 [Nonomuraea sp. PA05]TYB50769.1 cytochrome P450 [Nonomuraea sp. PA05]
MPRPPRLPGGLPWLGHARAFGRDPVSFLRRGREAAGDVYSFHLLGQEVVFACGPPAHETVFHADESVLSPREAYRFMSPVFGAGIAYDAEPAVMDEQLGFVRPALTSARLQTYLDLMVGEAEEYFSRWGREGTADLAVSLNELTVAIAGRCLVGEEFQQRLSGELPGLYHDLESGIRLAGLLNPYLPLPAFRRRDRARRRIAAAIGEIVRERRRTPAPDRPDLLSVLMASSYADGSPLTEETVAGLLLALIFAGQHTSAVLATWTGVLLLEHPEHLPPLLAELDAAFATAADTATAAADTATAAAPDAGSALDLRTLLRLQRLDHCVREAERLRPPLVVLLRKALRPIDIDGHRVEPGTLVMLSPGVSHRLPHLFRDPDRYDPGRHAQGREEGKAAYSLIGFGGGKHRCVGLAFAYQQVKVIWAVLLRRFELELVRSPNPPDYSTFVPGPRAPCLVRYRSRQSASQGER